MNSISKKRTTNYVAQLKISFIFKVLAMFFSFMMVPIMIRYLGSEKYGVWSTLISISTWIVLFDLGIGNGLRNKISESIAVNRVGCAQNYISTAYVLIGGASILIGVFSLWVSNFIPWGAVFNTSILSEHDLLLTVNATICFVLVNFLLSLVNQVFNGLQKTGLVVLNQFLSNALSFLFIWLLTFFIEGSIVLLAIVYGAALCFSNVLISVWFFSANPEFKPIIKSFKKECINAIVSLGFKFFVIQIAVIILFTTDKIVITQLFGPEHVTEYDVVFKLFSCITIIQGVIMAPLWGAYSDAYHRHDLVWLQDMMKKQLKFFLIFVLIVVLLVFFAPHILGFWVGQEFTYNHQLYFMMGLFVLISCWNSIFAIFVNGVNRLRLQFITSIIALIINIPLSIFLVKFWGMGVDGVVLGTILSLSLFGITAPVQVYSILNPKENFK